MCACGTPTRRKEEIGGTLLNTGVYALRSDRRTRKLVDTWLSMRNTEKHDQALLNRMAFVDYMVSSSGDHDLHLWVLYECVTMRCSTAWLSSTTR